MELGDRAVATPPAPDAGAEDGYFGPDRAIWRVNREAAMLLSGGAALLLQLAHPLVAAGVTDHSDFRAEPARRLRRTMDAMLSIIFGRRAEADQVAAQIRAVHERVRGRLGAAVGIWPCGAAYDAQDPALLLWVHATLVHTSMSGYELFVRPFCGGERERYYADTKTIAELVGIPRGSVPPTPHEFARYWDAELTSGRIAVGPAARALAPAILYPGVRYVPRTLFRGASLLTIGLLPPLARAAYGYRWSVAREAAFRAASAALRRAAAMLPERVRLFPQARAAERQRRAPRAGGPGCDSG